MIKCPKCGGDNQIGAIFCRSCGDKLELDELQPADIVRAGRRGPVQTFFLIAGRAVKLLVLLGLVACLALLFVPPKDTTQTYGGAPLLHSARRKIDTIKRESARPARYILTRGELNAYADLLAGFLEGEAPVDGKETEQVRKDILNTVDVHVWPLGGGYVKCVLESELLQYVPLYVTVVFRLTVGEEGLETAVDSAKVGRLPMIGPAVRLPLARFKALFPDVEKTIEQVAPYIRDIQTVREEVVVVTGE